MIASKRAALTGLAIGTAGAWALHRFARRPADLTNQVVLITGGSRGLGLLLAREFARVGCRLVLCARDATELDAATEDLEDRGADVLAVPCDVGRAEEVESLVRIASSHFGRIDIVVNNASIIQVGPLAVMDLDDFRRAMNVNFWGTVHTTLAVLPQMQQRRSGRIVNITSIGAKVAVPHLLPYDCAKFAALGFSEGLRAELAGTGVRVTTVVPGLMRTGSPVNAYFKGQQSKEFAWFSVGDATPLTAMDAERAARRIVLAARRGEPYIALTWQARLLRVIHDLMPGLIADAAGLVNRLLPSAEGGSRHNIRGMQLANPVAPSPLTAFMNRAARELNQYGGMPTPAPRHARKVGLRPNGHTELVD